MTGYRTSEFLTIVDFGHVHVLSHAVTGERLTVKAHLGNGLRTLTGRTGFDAEELAAAVPGADPAGFLDLLLGRHLVLPAGTDERAQFASLIAAEETAPAHRERAQFWQPSVIDRTAGPLRPLRILAFGGCVTEFARDALARQGAERGLDVALTGAWPESPSRVPDLVSRHEPDLVVLQPTVVQFLTALSDGGPFAEADERRRLLNRLRDRIDRWVTAIGESLAPGRHGIVHNLGHGALSPYGRFEYAVDVNTRQVVAELNAHLDRRLREHANLWLLDEERLVARHGAQRLFDDWHFPFGHHGGSVDPAVDRPHQLPLLGEVLAREYLDIHTAATASDTVKCVVSDLDGTLWPGIAADDGFGWLDADTTTTWTHLGLHQALRLLKARGLLLVSCSKGDAEQTLPAWEGASHPWLLRPDDFVLHDISWEPKSQRIARAIDRLGLSESAVMFLDDNPIERHEVGRALPGVRILDGPVHGFRSRLLTDPLLDRPPATAEARTRTATTRGMLERDTLAAALTTAELAAEVDARIDIAPADGSDLPRLAELLARTNQFRTSADRPGPETLAKAVARGQVYRCRVRDRYADYGLCGVCVIEDGAVTQLVVSCRVIGLDVGLALLNGAIRIAGTDTLDAAFTPTGRNTPAADVFERAGFTALGPTGDTARYRLGHAGDLAPLDPYVTISRPAEEAP
jgi:FkbH-like protein